MPGINDNNLSYQQFPRQNQPTNSISNLSNNFQQQLYINNNYSVPKAPSPSLQPSSPRVMNQNNTQFVPSPQPSHGYPVQVMNVQNPQQDSYVNLMLNNGNNQQNISQQQFISTPSQNSPMYVAQSQPVGPTLVYMQEPKRQQVVLQQQQQQHPQNYASIQQERVMYQNVIPATNPQQNANYQPIANMNYVQQSQVVPQVPTANYSVMSNPSGAIPMVNQNLPSGNMTVSPNQGKTS